MSAPTKDEFIAALQQRHGVEMQQKLMNSSVAVCGLGGLGSNIAIALARAGVGRLHLIDFDRVDISNLNRQQYRVSQLGKYKTEALCEQLKDIAPYVELTADTVKLDEDNIPSLLKNEDIICEAFDLPEEKAMLVNTVLECFPDKYLVAGSGMAGLGSANSIRTRRVMKNFYLCGDEVSAVSETSGLFSARVMLCAAHEAMMILRLIADKKEA